MSYQIEKYGTSSTMVIHKLYNKIAILLFMFLFVLIAKGQTTEVYAIADDGTPLHWNVYRPSTTEKRSAVLVIHGGEFRSGTPGPGFVAQDLSNAGYVAFAIEYRLAPPGSIAGQVSRGHYPDQTNDVSRAVQAARTDPRCNGRVGAVGGSAGASHVAYVANLLDAGVCLSGPYNFSDPATLSLAAIFQHYVNSSNPSTLLAASPISFVTQSIPPLFLIASANDSIGPDQLPDMVDALLAAGLTNYKVLILPGNEHSFVYWDSVRSTVISFLQQHL